LGDVIGEPLPIFTGGRGKHGMISKRQEQQAAGSAIGRINKRHANAADRLLQDVPGCASMDSEGGCKGQKIISRDIREPCCGTDPEGERIGPDLIEARRQAIIGCAGTTRPVNGSKVWYLA
jgi:reverse gyrase